MKKYTLIKTSRRNTIAKYPNVLSLEKRGDKPIYSVIGRAKISQYISSQIRFLIIPMLLISFCANAQPLDELLQTATENNPTLKSLQLEYEAALQKGPQVSQLTDPQIGVGVPILRPETRLGGQVFMVSASQMFPWFGTLQAKEDVAIAMAKPKFEKVAAEQAELFYTIKSAYYKLYLMEQQQKVIAQNIRLYETMEQVSLAKLESGKSIASDVLKVQLKVKKLQNQLLLIDNQKAKFYAQINQAIHQPLTDSIHITQTFDEVALLEFDLANYKSKLEANHPAINQIKWQIETSNKALALNKLEGMPTIGVGVDYSLITPRTDMIPDNNGRDVLIPKVMVSIPIARKKYAAKRQEETLLQEAYEWQRESIIQQILMEVQTLKTDYYDILLNLDLLKEQLTLTQSAYNVLLSEYSSKGTRFDELIRLQDELLQYQLDEIDAVIQSYIVVSKIDRLTNF